MMKPLKIGLLVVGVLMVGTLLTLRVTGLAPGHPSAEEYTKASRSARPCAAKSPPWEKASSAPSLAQASWKL